MSPDDSTPSPLYDLLAGGPALVKRARRDWPAVIVLALITVFALGPVVGLIGVLRADRTTTETVVEPTPAPVGGVALVATLTGMAPTTGELGIRILVQPDLALVRDGGLAEDLTVRVNDARGSSSTTFPAGTPAGSIEATLALTTGSISVYPFDDYTAPFIATATLTGDGEAETVPVSLGVRSTINGFEVSAEPAADPIGDPSTIPQLVLALDRSLVTQVYVVGMMALMWGLAMSGVLMAWSVVIRDADTPIWAYAFFVGVLFALPPLRDSLPGDPPPGTLLDFVAFYWSVAIVGVTLLLLVLIWIRRTRRLQRLGDSAQTAASPASPATRGVGDTDLG